MTHDNRSAAVPSKRVRLAQALALIALVAALVGALGPAERVRTTYSWPPKDLPAGAPSNAWYTPLLLVRHRPEAISARIPCTLAPALPNAGSPVTVLATARHPERSEGLAVTKLGDRLVLAIGGTTLDQARLRPGHANVGECAYDLRLGAGAWSIEGGPNQVARGGRLETLPKVSGLFSGLDLRSGTAPAIEVTTTVHATRTTLRQTVAWTLAVLGAIIALLLVSVERTPRPWSVTRRATRAAVSHAHPVDAVVAAALVGWWFLSPAFFDDGWIQAREQMFSSSRGFSIYYHALATNLPLDYWVEWMHHWVAQASNALLILRIPTLACLASVWVFCRWIFVRVQDSPSSESPLALWALACAFLLGAMAWGMTLRPEPVTGLLVVGVMACMVRFRERETAASVAAGAGLVTLALTAHPAGVVSLAAVAVAAPVLVRWAWSHLAGATAIVASACALLTTLLFVGSDLGQRVLDAQTIATYPAVTAEWRDETARYVLLAYEPYGTPLRRASVVLILLAVLAFVLRRRRNGWSLLDFPAAVLAVGLLLLIATPSKWPWHFGTLIGIGAVTVAAETEHLRRAASLSRNWRAWPLLAVGAATIVGAWSWRTRAHWNPADLRTLDWTPAFETNFSLSQLAGFVPVILLAVALLVALIRGRRSHLHAVPWRVASWTAPVLAVPTIVFTAATLVADTAKTSSWTLARQNIETIVGDPGCGLADDMLVSVAESARPLSTSAIGRAERTPAWVPPAPVASLQRFALGPAAEGSTSSPWFTLPADRRVGVFVAGTLAPSDSLWLEWGRVRRGRIDRLGTDEFTHVLDSLSGNARWRFFAAEDLPAPEPRATSVRITFRADISPGSAVAVTAPVTYANRRLGPEMSSAGSRTLVYPEVLPYFPCTQLPVLRDGAVEVPQHVVTTDNGFSVLSEDVSSSFLGLLDLYEIERVPVAGTKSQPEPVLVFAVDRLIPGAKLVPPDRATFTS